MKKNILTRRTFLKVTGGSACSIALPSSTYFSRHVPALQSKNPEVVVIGAGAFGGWTALYLQEMGHSVRLVDAYGPGNARSSSGGETRQIRASYGERELYSRWAVEALKRWKTREQEWERRLLYPTGQITLSREWTNTLQATKRVLDRLGVENERVEYDELAYRYPQFNLDEATVGHWVPSTGVLKCREGCLAVAEAFKGAGGQLTIARGTPNQRASGQLQSILLSTGETVSAQSFVFACGPWHVKMFPEILGNKLKLNRRVIFFMGTPMDASGFVFPNCPTFVTKGVYGFPNIEGKGLKLGPYWDSGSLDPDTDHRAVTADEVRRIQTFTSDAFPTLANQPLLETRISPRTNSVDAHFMVDRHPELSNVWLIGAGSGHGFKHGIMLGDYVARRVVGLSTDAELDAAFRIKKETF